MEGLTRDGDKINSNALLKQCFTCKNNLDCWHLRGTPIHGRSSNAIKLNRFKTVKFMFKNQNVKTFEYFTIRKCIELINPSMKRDEKLIHEYTQQVMCVLEGLSGCTDDFWTCPADGVDKDEVPEEERFSYIPRAD